MPPEAESNLFMAPNQYFDPYFERDAVKILPGEYYVTQQDTMIVTVLGSCIAACIRDPVRGIAGMNHFLLPNDERADVRNPVAPSARYGAYAMELLINQLLKLGASRTRLQAKIFGGGNVLRGLASQSVGERNAEFVESFLHEESIPILASDVAGDYPRKVYFFPDNGQVKVKKIRSLHNTTILDRESEYRMRLRHGSANGGDVELFDQ